MEQERLDLILPPKEGMSVAIIPCTSQKSDVAGPAREVWTGAHFQLGLAYAEIYCDFTYVMSFKYGLITPDQKIQPYDLHIKNASIRERLEWWLKLREHVAEVAKANPRVVLVFTGDWERDRFVREWVRNGIREVVLPWQGLGLGQRMQRVYDGIAPFEEEKLQAGEYTLPETYGETQTKDMKEMQAARKAEKEKEFDFEEEWVE